jgi:hypothetical protein
MHPSTRHVALRAAAKVTLSAAILGCGGATEAVTVDASDGDATPVRVTTHQDAAAARDALAALDAQATPDAPDAPALACPGAVADPTATVAASTFACCTSFLEGSLLTADSGVLAVDPSLPTTLPCCAAAVAYVDGAPSAFGSVAGPVLASCCHELATVDAGPPVGPACTPWGPPVPPAMPGALATEVA